MDIDKYLASPWMKYMTIGIGVITIICSVYDMSSGSGIAAYSLSCLGFMITVLAILLFLYHHDEGFQNSISTLTTTDSS